MSDIVQLGKKRPSVQLREFVVLSGKGGTGKTSLTAALIAARSGVVAADCDVEAANLAVLFDRPDDKEVAFSSGRKASVNADLCFGCGACMEVCRFDAMSMRSMELHIDSVACEGCGACAVVCPVDAIEFHPVHAGHWAVRALPSGGVLVHAELEPGEDRSGRLVSEVRTQARKSAEALALSTIIIDGPPGIGCPVHAALSGVQAAVLVTEPTRAAISDLDRVLSTAAHFRVPVGVVINKCDLAPEQAREVEALCDRRGVPVVGRVPFDRLIPEALGRGEVPSVACVSLAETARQVWSRFDQPASLAIPCASSAEPVSVGAGAS